MKKQFHHQARYNTTRNLHPGTKNRYRNGPNYIPDPPSSRKSTSITIAEVLKTIGWF